LEDQHGEDIERQVAGVTTTEPSHRTRSVQPAVATRPAQPSPRPPAPAPLPEDLDGARDLAREAVSALLDEPTTPSIRQAHQAVTTYLELERAVVPHRCLDALSRRTVELQHEVVASALVAVLDASPAHDVLRERAFTLRHVLLRHISVSRQLLDPPMPEA
jgi:hypothetical protein